MSDYLSCADTAKLIRAALKAAFPGVKFSVTSSTSSGGGSISVKWLDGPRQSAVDAIAGRFAGATCDGMQDLKEYHDIEVNGAPRRTLADFVFCSRSISDYESKRLAANQFIRAHCQIIPGSSERSDYFGNTSVDDLAQGMARDMEAGDLMAAFRRIVLREEEAA